MYSNTGPYTVYVHDLTGQQLHSWIHEDRGNISARALAVINNELIIADRTNKRFTIYTLTGDRVRNIPCDLIYNDCLTICHAADNSILVTNFVDYPELYRVNLTTGEVEWRSYKVSDPIGAVMYSKETSGNGTMQVNIWTVKAATGEELVQY